MSDRRHLEHELALVADRLASLPPAHQAECPAKVSAHRTALIAYQESLEAQLSTAIVEERRRAVDKQRHSVGNHGTTTRTTSTTRPAVPTDREA